MKFLFGYNMKELEPGDQIVCQRLKVTIKKIEYQDYYEREHNTEFRSIDGVYRSWKSVYDGGYVIPHRIIINPEASFNNCVSISDDRELREELSKEEYREIKNRFYEELKYVKRFQDEKPELTYGDFNQYCKNIESCYGVSLPVLNYIYTGYFEHIEKYFKETKNL